MNLFRLLLLLALVWIVWRLLAPRLRAASRRPVQPDIARPENYEPMSQCAKCGTYLPAKALSREGRCGRCGE
jgi:hypothetical protein